MSSVRSMQNLFFVHLGDSDEKGVETFTSSSFDKETTDKQFTTGMTTEKSNICQEERAELVEKKRNEQKMIVFIGSGGNGKASVIHALIDSWRTTCESLGMVFDNRMILITGMTGVPAKCVLLRDGTKFKMGCLGVGRVMSRWTRWKCHLESCPGHKKRGKGKGEKKDNPKNVNQEIIVTGDVVTNGWIDEAVKRLEKGVVGLGSADKFLKRSKRATTVSRRSMHLEMRNQAEKTLCGQVAPCSMVQMMLSRNARYSYYNEDCFFNGFPKST